MTDRTFARRCVVVLDDGRRVDAFLYATRDEWALVSFQRRRPGVMTIGWWPGDRVEQVDAIQQFDTSD